MDEEGIMYLAFSMVIMLMALAFIPSVGKGIISILALVVVAIGILVVLMLNFADFLLVSLVFGYLGITIEPAQSYKIIKSQNAIVKEVNGLSYATGYVAVNLFDYAFKLERPPEDEEQKMLLAPETWERAVMNIGFPFKFHVISTGLDVQKVRDEFEGKRSYQEFQLSRAFQSTSNNEVVITNIQRKLNVIQAQIDRISIGEKPIATIMYIETTAIGVSEKAALDALTQQINDIRVSFSSMDVDMNRVMGRELYNLFNFSFALPTTIDQLSSYFDTQK